MLQKQHLVAQRHERSAFSGLVTLTAGPNRVEVHNTNAVSAHGGLRLTEQGRSRIEELALKPGERRQFKMSSETTWCAEVQNWATLDLTKVDPEKIKSWEKVIGDFFLSHTKEELYHEALEKRIPLAPLNDMSEVVKDEQLAARDFWADVEHAELKTNLRYPGFLFLTSEEKCLPKVRRRAPFIDEHNSEIYLGELGLRETELNSLRKEGIV